MGLKIIVIDSNQTTADFQSVVQVQMGGLPALQSIEQYFAALQGGLQTVNNLRLVINPISASGTFTFSSTGPTNNQTCIIAGTTFTAKTSASLANEFTISATPATVATNLANAINASPQTSAILTAVAALGVVTITLVSPGPVGNGIVFSAGTLSNTVAVSPTGGDYGTAYTILA